MADEGDGYEEASRRNRWEEECFVYEPVRIVRILSCGCKCSRRLCSVKLCAVFFFFFCDIFAICLRHDFLFGIRGRRVMLNRGGLRHLSVRILFLPPDTEYRIRNVWRKELAQLGHNMSSDEMNDAVL